MSLPSQPMPLHSSYDIQRPQPQERRRPPHQQTMKKKGKRSRDEHCNLRSSSTGEGGHGSRQPLQVPAEDGGGQNSAEVQETQNPLLLMMKQRKMRRTFAPKRADAERPSASRTAAGTKEEMAQVATTSSTGAMRTGTAGPHHKRTASACKKKTRALFINFESYTLPPVLFMPASVGVVVCVCCQVTVADRWHRCIDDSRKHCGGAEVDITSIRKEWNPAGGAFGKSGSGTSSDPMAPGAMHLEHSKTAAAPGQCERKKQHPYKHLPLSERISAIRRLKAMPDRESLWATHEARDKVSRPVLVCVVRSKRCV